MEPLGVDALNLFTGMHAVAGGGGGGDAPDTKQSKNSSQLKYQCTNASINQKISQNTHRHSAHQYFSCMTLRHNSNNNNRIHKAQCIYTYKYTDCNDDTR